MKPRLLERLSEEAVDLFAGAGGWEQGARHLGLHPLGIEWDDAACDTREAAGLRTLQADVSKLDPLDFAPNRIQIASPPCPSFSSAGKGLGIEDLPLVYEAASAIDAGEPVPELDWKDERSALVIEPLRWALALEPDFLAWEQVPPVLPFWEFCAGILRERGWSVWTGILEAERYGVPQTRKRAILMASKLGHVEPPRPTHQRYVKGEPQRHDVTLEGEVLPWVSMAEALGWAGTLTGNHSIAGGPLAERASDEPALTVGSRVDLWKLRANAQENATERAVGEPAPTIKGGNDVADRVWVYDRRQGSTDENGNRTMVRPIPATEPAPTISAQGLAKGRDVWAYDRPAPTIVTTRRSKDGILVGRQLPEGEGENVGGWGYERPYTTVNGDPRISPPGYRGRADEYDADGNYKGERSMDKAIRVTLEEAAVLQSFPPDYPFQGTKSKRFLQVGNAVPPLLAHAILTQLLSEVLETNQKAAA